MDFDHFRVVGYGLVPDSGGAGRHRGGLGLWRSFEVLKDGTNFACYSDRAKFAPWGLFGGEEGARTRIELKRGDRVMTLDTKTRMDLERGDVLTIYTAGGGGYGPPSDREGARIARDIRNGFVTAEAATDAYGRTS